METSRFPIGNLRQRLASAAGGAKSVAATTAPKRPTDKSAKQTATSSNTEPSA